MYKVIRMIEMVTSNNVKGNYELFHVDNILYEFNREEALEIISKDEELNDISVKELNEVIYNVDHDATYIGSVTLKSKTFYAPNGVKLDYDNKVHVRYILVNENGLKEDEDEFI